LKIVYNFLNLPKQITKTGGGGGSLQFTYDVSGRKWKKEGAGGKREYVLGMEYQDGRLEAIHGPDGRLASVHGFGYYRPEYWHTDHLGNVRLAFADKNNNGRIEIEDDPGTPGDDTEIMQENHYYPFGMNQLGPWYETVTPPNKYQYNGKDLNEELGLDWYDYGARWYDGSIGRWGQVDPIAEKYYSWSIYNYTLGNPVRFLDPDGMRVDDIIVGEQKWTPGAVYSGQDDFGKQVFAALNYLVEQGVSQFSFTTIDGITHSGDALLDFVEGGKFANVEITIKQGDVTQALGGSITFDPNKGIMVHTTLGDNGIAPSILLLHEFGHEWQRNYFGVENYSNPLLGDHEMSIIENLEVPAAQKLNMGIRNSHVTFNSKEQAINHLKIGPEFQRNPFERQRAKNMAYNYFFETQGPNRKEPKKN
jgi:RHS repeat-associated protein